MTFIDKARKKAEVGTLAFGYFSAVLYSVIALGAVVLMAIVNSHVSTIRHSIYEQTEDRLVHTESIVDLILVELIYAGAFLYSILAVTFSVYLIIGIQKKYPGYVKAYFIYGIVTLMIYVAGFIGTCISVHTPYSNCCIGFAVVGIAGCVIYAAILTMINTAYKNMISHETYEQFDDCAKSKEANLQKV